MNRYIARLPAVMGKLVLASVATVLFARCASVEDKDAKCQHLGSQPRAAVSGDDAVWFKNNCGCNETLATLNMMGIPAPTNACYFPGSKHHQEVVGFQARVDARAKDEEAKK